MRLESQAATGNEIAASRLEPKKKSAGGGERQVELLEQPQRQQRLHHKTAGEGVEAEQRGQFVDDASGWPERRCSARWRGK